MTQPAIRISNLSKRYTLGARGKLFSRILCKAASASELWALRDVSFEARRGEVLGIIGHNGAGKSTLLKVLSRITEPTAGTVELYGRVASLLEVGTGFHPDLTGRENIYLNGTIMGLTRREIAARFGDIVDFSGIEKFLDTPVKRYSSGMHVRLAFAVAAHLEPDILIADEVLAVGDAAFQAKCLGKMKLVASGGGRTVLFVSHNMQAVRGLCQRVAWMEGGRLRAIGDAEAITRQYMDETRPLADLDHVGERIAALPGDPDFRLLAVDVTQDGKRTTNVSNAKPVQVRMTYETRRAVAGLRLYFDLCDEYGDVLVRSFHDEHDDQPALTPAGVHTVTATLPAHLLAPRPYTLALQAGIYNVRYCMGDGIRLALTVDRGSRVNLAYPHDPIAAKLQPHIAWSRTQHQHQEEDKHVARAA